MAVEGDFPSDGLKAALEPHIPALRRFARALLREPDAADDLVQECLLRAISRLHQQREEGGRRAWLFAILHNLFVGGRRTLRRHGGPPLPLQDEDGPQALPAGRGAAEDRLVLQDVLLGLKTLNEEQRVVLLLVGVEDLSYEEAARVTGVPVGTVMSRLSRGRERLRQFLEGDAVGPQRPAQPS